MEVSQRFMCSLCFKTFGRKDHLKRHTLTHGEKLFKCDECYKAFTTPEHLKRHKKTHRDNEYQCAKCWVKFAKFESLKRHIVAHTENAPFRCEECDEGFAKAGDLKRHRIIHTNEPHVTCTLCGNIYFRQEHLARHMLTHVADKPYKCEVCYKEFTRKEHLSKHLETHNRYNSRNFLGHSITGDQLMLIDSAAIKVELDETADEAGKAFFECDVCYELFLSAADLQSHIKCHVGVNSFSPESRVDSKDYLYMETDVKSDSLSYSMDGMQHVDRFDPSLHPEPSNQTKPVSDNHTAANGVQNIKVEVTDEEEDVKPETEDSHENFHADRGKKDSHENFHADRGNVPNSRVKEEKENGEVSIQTGTKGADKSQKSEFQCEVCKCYFVGQEFVDKHMSKHRKYTCDQCGEHFPNMKYYKIHMKSCSAKG